MRALAVLVLVSLAAPTWAQRADRAAAAAEAAEGDEALAAGDPNRALRHYRQAHDLYPSPNLRFNMALALTELGRALEAIEEYEQFLATAETPPPKAIEHAKKQIALLEARIGRLTIGLPDGAYTVEVFVDDRRLGAQSIGRALRVMPGTHEVQVRAEGMKPYSRTVTVGPGDSIDVKVVFEPIDLKVTDPTPSTTQIAAPNERDRGAVLRRWWFWAGAAAVVTAAVVIALAIDSDPDAPLPESDLGVVEPRF